MCAGALNLVMQFKWVSNCLYLNQKYEWGYHLLIWWPTYLENWATGAKITQSCSCDTKIWATNAGCLLTMNFRIMISLLSLGYPITDADSPSPLYNSNKAYVKWCHNLTTKSNRHIEHHKNAVKEWVEDGSISISHISGRTNPSDIFTKEMQYGPTFRHLCNSFMSHGSDSLCSIYNNLHPYSKPLEVPNLPSSQMIVAQRAQYIPPKTPGILDILILHTHHKPKIGWY